MRKIANKLVAVFVTVALFGCSAVAVGAQDSGDGDLQTELPVGKEISAAFKEIITSHSAAVEDFIAEVSYLTTTAQEARLDLIESRQSELTAKVNDANAARQELIAQYENGEISREAFVAALRGLAAEVSAAARSMGTLGEQLAAIGTELAANLQQHAEDLVAANESMASSMAQAGLAIGEQMRNRGYGPPEGLSGGAPEDLPPEGLPGGAPEDLLGGPPQGLPIGG